MNTQKMKRREFLIPFTALVVILAMITFCTAPDTSSDKLMEPGRPVDLGRSTESIDMDHYESIYHVSSEGSDDAGSTAAGSSAAGSTSTVSSGVSTLADGSKQSPFTSIEEALRAIVGAGESAPRAILVSSGSYVCNAVQMKEYVDLYGGFDPVTWERDIAQNQTLLTGGEQSRVLLGADHSRLDGFYIMGGRYRGNGGAVYCEGTSPEISNNYFFRNSTLEPRAWNPEFIHEKAHDGGAFYAENGASPMIRNNIFVGNETENGRGGAVAFHGRCKGEIRNNIFLNNSAGLNDGFRSSDGGAVSIFDGCNTDVIDNLFIGNRALTNNDGGGLFVALWSSARIHGNYFFNNEAKDDAGSLFVGGQEHRYDSPLDPLPPAKDFFVSLQGNVIMGGKNPSMNSGAFRITMETRGELSNNLIAYNSGVYFQRSDLGIYNNTIIDNVLLLETKEGLNPCQLKNNIILGKMILDTKADFKNNLVLEMGWGEPQKEIDPEAGAWMDQLGMDEVGIERTPASGSPGGDSGSRGGESGTDGKASGARGLEFVDDGLKLDIAGLMAGKDRTETRLIVHGVFESNSLKNRIVQAGTRFTLIKENQGNEIILWDDLSPEREFIILPTYTPLAGSAAIDTGTDVPLEKDLYGKPRPSGEGFDMGAAENH